MKTIEILINVKGESILTTKGFSGASCREASRFLEAALGQRLGERLTADFHQAQPTQQNAQQQV